MNVSLAFMVTKPHRPHHSIPAKTDRLVEDALYLARNNADVAIIQQFVDAFARDYQGAAPISEYNSGKLAECVFHPRLRGYTLKIYGLAARGTPEGKLHNNFTSFCREARDHPKSPAAWIREKRKSMKW